MATIFKIKKSYQISRILIGGLTNKKLVKTTFLNSDRTLNFMAFPKLKPKNWA